MPFTMCSNAKDTRTLLVTSAGFWGKCSWGNFGVTRLKAVANGVDPSAKRQAEKSSIANSFEAVAREWLALQEKTLAPATCAKAAWTLETTAQIRLFSPTSRKTSTRVRKCVGRLSGDRDWGRRALSNLPSPVV
jgi:hypothetical protein